MIAILSLVYSPILKCIDQRKIGKREIVGYPISSSSVDPCHASALSFPTKKSSSVTKRRKKFHCAQTFDNCHIPLTKNVLPLHPDWVASDL